MAARRNGDDGAAQKRTTTTHSSRRSSYSRSPARSSSPGQSLPSRSPSNSPRTQRLRRAQEERELNRGRSRDTGMRRDDRGRDRDSRERGRNPDREKDGDRVRNRDRSRSRDTAMQRDRGRDRDSRDRDGNRDRERDGDIRVRNRDRYEGRDTNARREEDWPRDRRGREREENRNRHQGRDRDTSREEDWPRDRRGREREDRSRDDGRGRGRRVEASPVRSPARLRRDRSASPMDVQRRRQRSLSRSSPSQERGGSKHHDQRADIGTSVAAARDEGEEDDTRGERRSRGEVLNPRLDGDDAVTRTKEVEAALEAKEAKTKEKPSFEYSGKLAAETNKVKGVTLQFTEPPEARKPSTRWRLYVFKDGEPLKDPLYIHRQTCYLFGRERRVADIPTDHPSCSKQHAVIQYRLTEKEDAVDGLSSSKVRPYVMDLGSTNGTMLNGERLDPQRYYEMFEKDTIKFGNSSREYVLLHEHSIG